MQSKLSILKMFSLLTFHVMTSSVMIVWDIPPKVSVRHFHEGLKVKPNKTILEQETSRVFLQSAGSLPPLDQSDGARDPSIFPIVISTTTPPGPRLSLTICAERTTSPTSRWTQLPALDRQPEQAYPRGSPGILLDHGVVR